MSNVIYVQLLNEGSDAWRPVPAQHVSDDIYILGDAAGVVEPDDEEWEFRPYTRVKVAEKVFGDGSRGLVAIARVAWPAPPDLDLWRHNVWEAASTVGDKEFQRRTWVEGRGRRWISSPVEVYCGLFDNAALEEFLFSPEVALTDAQRAAGQRLIDKMNEFDKLGGPELASEQILAHPVWREAQLCADAFATLLFPDRPPQRHEED